MLKKLFLNINIFVELISVLIVIGFIIHYNLKTRGSTVESMTNNNNIKNDNIKNDNNINAKFKFENKDLIKEIKSMGLEPPLGFCEKHRSSGKLREEACSILTKSNCNKTSCCVYTNKKECVAGSRHGPLFTTKNGVKITGVNSYHHQGKMYKIVN